MNINKKILIISLTLIVLLLFSFVVMHFMTKKEYAKTWESFVKRYKDEKLNYDNENNYYAKEIYIKNKEIYAKIDENNKKIYFGDRKENDLKIVNKEIIDIFQVAYKDTKFTYIVDKEGRLYYLNNLVYSTLDPFYIILLGDYKKIYKMETKENRVIATDIDRKKYDLTDTMKKYVHFEKIKE